MQEYQYALYAGAGGWIMVDTLYLIQPCGVVKRVRNAAREHHFNEKTKEASHLMWELMPGNITKAPELCVDDIPKKPEFVAGMDGTMITAYLLEEGRIKKLWSAGDYGQIDVYNVIRKAFVVQNQFPVNE